jgi:hypothetical protein
MALPPLLSRAYDRDGDRRPFSFDFQTFRVLERVTLYVCMRVRIVRK